jgi:hypothetical protein
MSTDTHRLEGEGVDTILSMQAAIFADGFVCGSLVAAVQALIDSSQGETVAVDVSKVLLRHHTC